MAPLSLFRGIAISGIKINKKALIFLNSACLKFKKAPHIFIGICQAVGTDSGMAYSKDSSWHNSIQKGRAQEGFWKFHSGIMFLYFFLFLQVQSIKQKPRAFNSKLKSSSTSKFQPCLLLKLVRAVFSPLAFLVSKSVLHDKFEVKEKWKTN